MHESSVYVYPTQHPGDVRGMRDLIDSGGINPSAIQGVMITHEGDLVANHFALLEVANVLSEHTGLPRATIADTVPIQAMAGACGFMVPHTAVFVRNTVEDSSNGEKRFAVAGACTRRFEPHEVGSLTYARDISQVVSRLMKDADIESPADVHLVFVKAGWPNPHLYKTEETRKDLLTNDWWEAGALARGGAALGVALALGEINEDEITEDRVLRDSNVLYSTVAHCSSTEDRITAAVMLFGNSRNSTSSLAIGHGVLEDGLDKEGVKSILRTMGFQFDVSPTPKDLERIRYAWLKPKTAEAPALRGHRHTLMTHPALGAIWWMVEKAPIHSMVASVLGTTVIEVATGSEHQGPPGKPLLAVLASTS
jgi:cyanuric acid amidohydrolase